MLTLVIESESTTYNTGKVSLCWQKEQVVDAVYDVLRLDILLRFVRSISTCDRSVKADVRHSFHDLCGRILVIRQLILEDKVTSEGQNKVLQDVDRCLSAEQEH